MFTGNQIKAARALLGFTQEELAEKSGISVATIKRVEAEGFSAQTSMGTATQIKEAFEAAGIEFIPGGVRLAEEA